MSKLFTRVFPRFLLDVVWNIKHKNSKKIQVEGERLLSCGVCWEEHLHPIFIHVEVGLAHGKIGNYPIPPQHAAIQPPEQWWVEPCWGGRSPAGLPHHRLLRWAPDWAWWFAMSVLGPDLQGRWVSFLVSLLRFIGKRIFITFSIVFVNMSCK
jgi:hypothetical protein